MVASITPWNYPVQLLSWKIGAALAAGCTIVAKPPSYTPISPIKFMECFAEAGAPRGVVNLVTGSGRDVGEALVLHPLVRKVTFTGSTEVGRRIMALASQGLKRLTLELGNQTPMIVFADADLDLAVKGLLGDHSGIWVRYVTPLTEYTCRKAYTWISLRSLWRKLKGSK